MRDYFMALGVGLGGAALAWLFGVACATGPMLETKRDDFARTTVTMSHNNRVVEPEFLVYGHADMDPAYAKGDDGIEVYELVFVYGGKDWMFADGAALLFGEELVALECGSASRDTYAAGGNVTVSEIIGCNASRELIERIISEQPRVRVHGKRNMDGAVTPRVASAYTDFLREVDSQGR